MKGLRLATLAIVVGILSVSCGEKAFGQGTIAPSQQLGIGVFVGNQIAGGLINGIQMGGGATIQYAFSPAVQLGLQLGLLGTSDSGSASTTLSREAIYVRALFEGAVNSFIQGGFRLNQMSVTATFGNQDVTTSTSRNEVFIDAGLAYYITRNVGMYGAVNLLDIRLDPSETLYGINSGTIGIEWWFNP